MAHPLAWWHERFIARPIGPAALVKRIAQIMADTAPLPGDVIVWDRSQFDALSSRLGASRMVVYLHDFKQKLTDLVLGLSDDAVPLATIPGRVHDLRSIAGMFGFEELLDACSVIQKYETEDCIRDQLPHLLQAGKRAIAAIDAA